MQHNITLITGDGVGPEIAEAMKRCVEAIGVKINWDVQAAGIEVYEKEGDPLPKRIMDSIENPPEPTEYLLNSIKKYDKAFPTRESEGL